VNHTEELFYTQVFDVNSQVIIPVMYSSVPASQALNDRLDGINPLQRCSVQEHNNLSAKGRPNFITSIPPFVRAAGYLRVNCTTEVIDAKKLSQRNTLLTQFVRNQEIFL